jgi:hypothetical protein
MLNQNFQDPFVAIVIDPVRTISAGKVNLGAFRTYPKGGATFLVNPLSLDQCMNIMMPDQNIASFYLKCNYSNIKYDHEIDPRSLFFN